MRVSVKKKKDDGNVCMSVVMGRCENVARPMFILLGGARRSTKINKIK
jgi:hypothetical protein